MRWICLDCGYIFKWNPHEEHTIPKCPKCESTNVDVWDMWELPSGVMNKLHHKHGLKRKKRPVRRPSRRRMAAM